MLSPNKERYIENSLELPELGVLKYTKIIDASLALEINNAYWE